jgi:hypothetical protein
MMLAGNCSKRAPSAAGTELSREQIAVVICERHLIDGNWKDVLSRLAPVLNPPRLIVVARCSDNVLWMEVLNMGGFDLLSAPLREVEVAHAVGSAVFDWMEGGSANVTVSRHVPPETALRIPKQLRGPDVDFGGFPTGLVRHKVSNPMQRTRIAMAPRL